MNRSVSAEDESIWQGLDAGDRDKIKSYMRTRRVARGETLIEQGVVSDTLYIVNFGHFGVSNVHNGEIVAEIGKDQLIGEIGFFAGAPRSAFVTAMRDSEVFEIDRAEFDDLVMRLPEVQRAVTRSLAKRISRLAEITRHNTQARALGRVVTVLGAGSGGLPTPFLEALSRALPARARCRFLHAADATARFGGSAFNRFDVADWIGHLERDLDLVVCVASDRLDEWTQAVLHSTDQVLLVATGLAAPVNEVEAFAFQMCRPRNRRLVRLYERRPSQCEAVAPWIASRDVFMVHHVVMNEWRDLESLARFLTGQAIGFVAGAGGALGIAHIGVFKAFREQGITFDIFGGSSIGSGMAAAFARLREADEVEAEIHEIFVRNSALKRLTIPRYGLLDHKVLEMTLEKASADFAIEDLWRPMFAIAADLSTYSTRVMRRGPVWQAIRASCAIPGVLPPFIDDDGHMLVDGGVADNVPTETMVALKSGPNLVVDLRQLDHRLYEFNYQSIPGRLGLLARMLNPMSAVKLPACPNPASVIMQSIFSDVRNPSRAAAGGDTLDLVLHPPVCPGASLTTWDRHREIVDFAYQWTCGVIAELKQQGDPTLAAMEALSRPAAV